MPNGLNNWGYKDLTKFLKEQGFTFFEEKEGSHEAWINYNTNPPAVVEINKIKGGEAYLVRTLETMIRQSCIDKKIWRAWAGK